MALNVIHPLVFDNYKVDVSSQEEVIAGTFVRLMSDGADGSVVAVATPSSVLGVAGDTRSTDTAGTAYSNDLVFGAANPVGNPTFRTRSTQNRVSDYFDETSGSNLMTVYHSGGTFASTEFETTDSGLGVIPYGVGDPLYVSSNGKLTTVQETSDAVRVGQVVEPPTERDSGIPGVETPQNSKSLGRYLKFKLEI